MGRLLLLVDNCLHVGGHQSLRILRTHGLLHEGPTRTGLLARQPVRSGTYVSPRGHGTKPQPTNPRRLSTSTLSLRR